MEHLICAIIGAIIVMLLCYFGLVNIPKKEGLDARSKAKVLSGTYDSKVISSARGFATR